MNPKYSLKLGIKNEKASKSYDKTGMKVKIRFWSMTLKFTTKYQLVHEFFDISGDNRGGCSSWYWVSS